MAIEITMPQLSDTMSEGKILTWLKKEGDPVKRGDALAEVATDKADLEIESFHEGNLLKISAPEGTVVKVGTVIALIGEAGESVSAPSSPPKAAPAAQAASPAPESSQPSQPQPMQPAPAPSAPAAVAPASTAQQATPSSTDDRVKISPLARNIAAAHGVDYSSLAGRGSGEGGRIVRRDIETRLAHAPQGSNGEAPQPAAPQPIAARPAVSSGAPLRGKTEPLSKMRQTIATRMVESVTTVPHFYVTSKIMMDGVVKLKSTLKPLQQYEGVTYNHLIIKAAALALRNVPTINSAYQDGNSVQPSEINIGIVTAVSGGLLIPVLKNADQLPLADIVSEARGLVQRARTGRPKADDLVGGTFSISNMGMFAVESFTAIISPGQGAILAISGIEEEPIVVDGQIRVGQVMRATLSVDHRIIDGVMAGEFLTELKRVLEDPVLLLA